MIAHEPDTEFQESHNSYYDSILQPDDPLEGSNYDNFLHDFQGGESSFLNQNHAPSFASLPSVPDNGLELPSYNSAERPFPSHGHTSATPSALGPSSEIQGACGRVTTLKSSIGFQQPGQQEQRDHSRNNELDFPPADMPSSSNQRTAIQAHADPVPDNALQRNGSNGHPLRKGPTRRLTITLEHADPTILVDVLNAVLQSEAKVTFETN